MSAPPTPDDAALRERLIEVLETAKRDLAATRWKPSRDLADWASKREGMNHNRVVCAMDGIDRALETTRALLSRLDAEAAYRAKVQALCEAVDAQCSDHSNPHRRQAVYDARDDLRADHPEAESAAPSEAAALRQVTAETPRAAEPKRARVPHRSHDFGAPSTLTRRCRECGLWETWSAALDPCSWAHPDGSPELDRRERGL